MAYVPFDPTKPDGATQAGTAHSTSTRTNDQALRDGIISGQFLGYVFSATGGTAAQPTTMFWKNGAIWLRAQLTWGTGAGQDGNITQIIWSLSVNSGGAYDTIATETFTYDTSSNLTATTAAGGFMAWVMSYFGKWYKLAADFAAHIAAAGASVHGLGSISTQSAAAVNITGGVVSATIEREAVIDLTTSNVSKNVDWSLGGVVKETITGSSAAHTFSNLPNGVVGYMTFDLVNAGLSTFANLFPSVKRAGGVSPTLTASGRDVITLMCRDGSIVTLVGHTANPS